MPLEGHRAVLRIYTHERAKGDGGPLFEAIVKRAHAAKLAGATVTRGAIGFGLDGKVQRASILDLSGDLPLTIEIVDEEAKLRAFFQSLHGLEDIGLVTLQPIEVLHHGQGAPLETPAGK